jgi:hypothetical protein
LSIHDRHCFPYALSRSRFPIDRINIDDVWEFWEIWCRIGHAVMENGAEFLGDTYLLVIAFTAIESRFEGSIVVSLVTGYFGCKTSDGTERLAVGERFQDWATRGPSVKTLPMNLFPLTDLCFSNETIVIVMWLL